jgi:hypothetical protein
VLESAWNARSGRAGLPDDWDERLAAARVEPERLDAILLVLDDLAERWHSLPVGASLTLEWPRPERSRAATSRSSWRRRGPVRRPVGGPSP